MTIRQGLVAGLRLAARQEQIVELPLGSPLPCWIDLALPVPERHPLVLDLLSH